MHCRALRLYPEHYPTDEHYPFNQPTLRETHEIPFPTPITFFVGENGAGKSTLLEAMARACRIHIWRDESITRCVRNPYEEQLHRFIRPHWTDGVVPGSFFGADVFRDFAQVLDVWASTDPGQLKYFGGASLLTQSHGQSLMAFFRSRYVLRGLYLMDEPETALSPSTQLELLRLLIACGQSGQAQFVIATHSPILMACPGATIYDFDSVPVRTLAYEETEHYRVYHDFMADPEPFLSTPAETAD